MSEEKIRIQKFLSQQGICSRRQAETYIKARRVSINGNVATVGDRVGKSDILSLNGEVIAASQSIERVVVCFFKPKGVETTMSAVEGTKTILDYDFGVGRVFPVGRLDKDSQGMLLLTNDGDLANKLAHPKFQKEKEYLVSVVEMTEKAKKSKMYAMERSSGESRKKEKVVEEKEEETVVMKKNDPLIHKAKILAGGVTIDEKKTKPCKIEVLKEGLLQIQLKEGRNRQIRKMCEAVDLSVVDLLRVRIGKIKLGEMKPGKFRILSETEIGSL